MANIIKENLEFNYNDKYGEYSAHLSKKRIFSCFI